MFLMLNSRRLLSLPKRLPRNVFLLLSSFFLAWASAASCSAAISAAVFFFGTSLSTEIGSWNLVDTIAFPRLVPGAPGHDVEVEHRVDDKEQVHGGDGDVVNDAHGETGQLLGVDESCQTEGQGHKGQGERWWCEPAVLSHLLGNCKSQATSLGLGWPLLYLDENSNQNCHHDQGINHAEELGSQDLVICLGCQANYYEQDQWHQVDDEGSAVGKAKGCSEGPRKHYEYRSRSKDSA